MVTKADYVECIAYLEEEYKREIREHWNTYMQFKRTYGGYKHSWVVKQFKEKESHCLYSPVKEEEVYNPVKNTSGSRASVPSCVVDYLKVLSERQQAADCLTNVRLLNLKRSEEARGYGKFLTATKTAVGDGGRSDV